MSRYLRLISVWMLRNGLNCKFLGLLGNVISLDLHLIIFWFWWFWF